MAQRTTETQRVGEGSASAPNPRQVDSNISATQNSSRGQTRRPGRKTKGQKRRERQACEDKEEGFISSDDPANYYAQPKVSAAEHIASLPSIILTTAAPLDPAHPVIESGSRPPEIMDTDDAVTGDVIPIPQLQLRGDSSSSTSSLLPPARDKASSASSSRPLKWGRESPPAKRRRERQPPP